MPTLAKNNDRQLETGLRSVPTSSSYSQPWWQSFGNNAMPSSGQQEDASITSATLQSQGNVEGSIKETESSSSLHSGLNGITNGQGQQNLDANSQMELVGHSIMLTPYPYSDTQYGGIMTYGPPVHPHMLGYYPARIPLPLEMEEEPVYVNAKQYHGILRRRQIRAKAEFEKKAVKNRKPYLHESRHQHAMKRVRGSGGRFLNMKKLGDDAKNSTGEQSKSGPIASTQSCSSGSEQLSSKSNEIFNQQGDGASIIQDMHKEQTLLNGNSNSHGLSLYYMQLNRKEHGKDFSEDSWNLLVNHATQGPSPSK